MSEEVLRVLFVPGRVYSGEIAPLFSEPVVYELVSVNDVECIRRYYITSTLTDIPFDRLGAFRKRADTVIRWNRLTGERLASDLVPVSIGRKAT